MRALLIESASLKNDKLQDVLTMTSAHSNIVLQPVLTVPAWPQVKLVPKRGL